MNVILIVICTANYSFNRINHTKRLSSDQIAYEKYVKDKYKIEILCAGGADPSKDIYLLRYTFAKYDYVDLKEAQLMLYDLKETLCETINQDKVLRPYLLHFPFGAKDVEIAFTYYTALEGKPPKTFETISYQKDDVIISLYDEVAQKRELLYKADYKEFVEDVKKLQSNRHE